MLSCFSHVWLFATLWTIACLAPLSMGFCRQEYRGGLPCPLPGFLPNSGIEIASLASPALTGRFSYHWCPWEGVRMCVLSLGDVSFLQCHITMIFQRGGNNKSKHYLEKLNKLTRDQNKTWFSIILRIWMGMYRTISHYLFVSYIFQVPWKSLW